jgi:uncharacterized protein (TIGR04255 family)
MTEQHERTEYANPPVAEALCQLNFADPLRWNVATPGLLWERLREDYPDDPEAQDQIAASVQIGSTEASGVALNRGDQRFIYRDNEHQRLVVANSNYISVNSLPPHEGWPALRQRVEAAVGALSDTVPLQPVQRVALRYINRIVVPERQINTDDYFNIDIRTALDGKAMFRSFIYRVESVLDDRDTLMISTFATLQGDENALTFLLDQEAVRSGLSISNVTEMLEVADELHNYQIQEFESMITDKTRDLFA